MGDPAHPVGADQALAEAAGDFGRLARGAPRLVARPRTTGELIDQIALARERGWAITPRGLGSSQGGQSLSPGGLALDLSALDEIGPVDPAARTIACGAGARWRAVVERALAAGLVPRVLPLNLDLTVGGVLSIGGIGSTSHRHGLAAANVADLSVVSPLGEEVRCSPAGGAELFGSVLGGLGAFGVVARATLALRPAAARVSTWYLLYDDLDAWLADQRALIGEGRVDHVEGFCSAAWQGLRETAAGRQPFAHWFYGLHVSVEHDGEPPPLPPVRAYRQLHHEQVDAGRFAARYDPRFAGMRRSGAWEEPHPWLEALVPAGELPALLPRVLAALPPLLGDGHRLFFVARRDLPRFFAAPGGELACFAVLPVGIPPPLVDDALAAVGRAHDLIVAAGGKRYPSGWLGMLDAARWRNHLGDRWEEWRAARRRYDPEGRLGSVLLSRVGS